MSCSGLVSFVVILMANIPQFLHARDAITQDQPLRDGQTLISSDSTYELGFFSPGRSTNRYVGIWYYNFSTYPFLWVANREKPVPDRSGSLAISSSNNLVVVDGRNNIVWSSNVSMASNQSATAQLLDSGNLVLQSASSDAPPPAWQSFDHPTDTYLPGMKVGLDMVTGVNQVFTSWRSDDDPAPGNYSMGIDPRASTQIFIWEGDKPRWRSGRWNSQVFSGIPNMVPTYYYGFRLSNFQQEKKMYFYYNSFNSSHRYVLTKDGVEEHLERKENTNVWDRVWWQPATECAVYNLCGDNAKCTDGATPICECLKGFVPVDGEEWGRGQWSAGCVRRTALQCKRNGTVWGEEDGFWKMENVKVPDLSYWDVDVLNESACSTTCLSNCSCSSYAYVNGIGCLMWAREMVDVQMFSSGGDDFYLRLAASELKQKKKFDAVVVVLVVLALLLSLGCAFLFWRCKSHLRGFVRRWRARGVAFVDVSNQEEGRIHFQHEGEDEKWQELPLLSFDSIATSTENFSYLNLLGEGGFGPVYKGILPGGQDVAVKRLSKSSGQGLEEFKNEVILIAKLQHRNLVRLLGCCIQGEERILIYEYMPNRSLDAFIFDARKKHLLDWRKRYEIIEGIARGLLYLHRDSRLRVIHRDLKASNILLDEEMNPKISDFGLARIFGSDDKETNTKRVAGTYGYMSPEYAMNGLFSVKSDVYSFGVLLLEIISGERNSTFYHTDLSLNLLSYAWKLWSEGNVMQFVEPCMRASCSLRDVLRCINVGLLCVQDRANDRPTMATVMFMLESGISTQPLPTQPTFAGERRPGETDSSSFDLRVGTVNQSITMLSGR